jgi:hypothetical protein
MADRQVFHSISDRVEIPSGVVISVYKFQTAMRFFAVMGYTEPDFWNQVVIQATDHKEQLHSFQAPYLKQWLQANWFWLVQDSNEFSLRIKIRLCHQLGLL